MPSALILIAHGTEEMEFTITYDTLTRAGVECQSAFVHGQESSSSPNPPFAKCSRGLKIVPDVYFELSSSGPDKFDALIIPGGNQGAETISQHPDVQLLIQNFLRNGKIVGMICAGSLSALTSKVSKRPLTSHPGVRSKLLEDFEYSEDSVVVADGLVTSRGPGTTFPFAFMLVELLCGKEKKEEIRAPMVFPPGVAYPF